MSKQSVTTAFITAVTANDISGAAQSLDAGADINATIPADGRYPGRAGRWASKATPMLVFAASGNKQWLAMLELLITRGADLAATDARGVSAVAAAAREGVKAGVELLLDAGANPNQVTRTARACSTTSSRARPTTPS